MTTIKLMVKLTGEVNVALADTQLLLGQETEWPVVLELAKVHKALEQAQQAVFTAADLTSRIKALAYRAKQP